MPGSDYNNVPTTQVSIVGGDASITVAAGSIALAAQPCREIMLRVEAAITVYINIDADASATTPALKAGGEWLVLPLASTSLVNLYATGATRVSVLWRG